MTDAASDLEPSSYWPDKPQLLWTLGWSAFVIGVLYHIENPFILVYLAFFFGAVIVGLIVAGVWRGWELRRTPVAALLTASIAPAALLGWPFLNRAAVWIHFVQDRSGYEEIVDRVHRDPAWDDRGRPSAERGAYLVNRSRGAVRIAFVTKSGVVDNWAGIVWDRTGAVSLAGGESEPEWVNELFGGDIVACHRLSGHYFSCGFT